MVRRSKVGVFKPKAYVVTISSVTPTNIHEAMGILGWKASVHDELNALLRNKTWELVSVPSDRPLDGCKWLFKV